MKRRTFTNEIKTLYFILLMAHPEEAASVAVSWEEALVDLRRHRQRRVVALTLNKNMAAAQGKAGEQESERRVANLRPSVDKNSEKGSTCRVLRPRHTT